MASLSAPNRKKAREEGLFTLPDAAPILLTTVPTLTKRVQEYGVDLVIRHGVRFIREDDMVRLLLAQVERFPDYSWKKAAWPRLVQEEAIDRIGRGLKGLC